MKTPAAPLARLASAALVYALVGCASLPSALLPSGLLSSAGPARSTIEQSATSAIDALPLLYINAQTAQRLVASGRSQSFARSFPAAPIPQGGVGRGDTLQVSVWEAPPATLFGSVSADGRAGVSPARPAELPEQIVTADGSITVPFVGLLQVLGKTTSEIEDEIALRLQGVANQPQVLVRIARNASSNVTIVGEVAQAQRMPLTATGERLLDAIAAAGGVSQPLNKVTVQLTRNTVVRTMPLETVVRSPEENIPLAGGDVVAVYFQPYSLTVLGATGRNDEIPFEAQGLSLAQALGRVGGLQDNRADARGVFLFRFESPAALPPALRGRPSLPDGRVPVVYRLDLKNPASFLAAQNFPVLDKDVIYVANAPAAELQKFLNILTSSIYSASSLVNLGK